MSTLADWKLRGPVHTLRTEHATWDPVGAAWRPPRHATSVIFRGDGQAVEVVHHNPDGSLVRQAWIYDDAGRLVETRHWTNDDAPTRVLHTHDSLGRPTLAHAVTPDGSRREIERSTYEDAGQRTKMMVLPEMPPGLPEASIAYGIEGSDGAFGAPGAVTVTVVFDARGLPAVGTFLDAAGRVVSRVSFTRDDAGRVLGEEVRVGNESFLAGLGAGEPLPNEARAQLRAFTEVAFAGDVFTSTTRAYDPAGRLVERTVRFGRMSEACTRYEYNDEGDVVAEVSAGWNRLVNTDDDGNVVQNDRESSGQHTRYDHVYDAHGNWIERIVWSRDASQPEFTPSSIERRVITYHDR